MIDCPLDTEAAQTALKEEWPQLAERAETPEGRAEIAEQYQLSESVVTALYHKKQRTDYGQMQG